MNSVLETIQRVKQTCRDKAEGTSMTVICCGLPRTGTNSRAKALEILGCGPVYHGSMSPALPGDWAA